MLVAIGWRCVALGTRYTVHGTRCTVHGARCTVHGAWCREHGLAGGDYVRRSTHLGLGLEAARHTGKYHTHNVVFVDHGRDRGGGEDHANAGAGENHVLAVERAGVHGEERVHDDLLDVLRRVVGE